MKATDVVRLNHWITNNRGTLASSERGTLNDCAAMASEALGFKVPSSAMRELMLNAGIETKRLSKTKSRELAHLCEIEKLKAENMELRRTLAKVDASGYVPADVKDLLFAGLNDEIRAAIFQKA